MAHLSERLKEMREHKGLTQRGLAKELNVSPSAIALYETNRRHPDNDMLKKIADHFNTSVDYLLGRTNDPVPHKNKTEKEIEFEEFMKNHTIMYQGVPMTDEEKESVNEFLKTAFKILRADGKPKKQKD